MCRYFAIVVAVVLALPEQAAGVVYIWLSESDSGSPFPESSDGVPMAEPFVGASETIYIWGRPDDDESLVNVSLNLVAETQEVCSLTCVTPAAISFTSATLYNEPFGPPTARRFEFVDDSFSTPTLPIESNFIEGIEGVIILNTAMPPAVGIGSPSDELYDSVNESWLIAAVTYDVLATGAGTETQLFLEIGPNGMSHAGETTSATTVVFGHMGDDSLNGESGRGMHPGDYDAVILPRRLPGDADGDGDVESDDYAIWRRNFRSTSFSAADHNENGVVDAADYVIWRKYLGLSAGSGGANSIPEPSAAVSVLFALATLLSVCRP